MGTDQRPENYLKPSTPGKEENSCTTVDTRLKSMSLFSDHSSPSSSSTLYLALKHDLENQFFSLYGIKMCASQQYFLRDNTEDATPPRSQPTQSTVAASTEPCASEHDY